MYVSLVTLVSTVFLSITVLVQHRLGCYESSPLAAVPYVSEMAPAITRDGPWHGNTMYGAVLSAKQSACFTANVNAICEQPRKSALHWPRGGQWFVHVCHFLIIMRTVWPWLYIIDLEGLCSDKCGHMAANWQAYIVVWLLACYVRLWCWLDLQYMSHVRCMPRRHPVSYLIPPHIMSRVTVRNYLVLMLLSHWHFQLQISASL